MKLTTKVILWAWLVLMVILGSLIYGAYSKLNPESLVSLLNTQIQRSYPGSNLTIAKIDYGFSLDFKLKLKTLTLTRSQKTLATAHEVQLKVPWWLILFNRGNAAINVSDLIIFVSSSSSHANTAKDNSESTAKTNQVAINLPQYLLDAQYTLRAKNISIKEIDGDRRFFTLSKLLVREFQYGKNSAFELNIPINISHKDKSYSSDLWLFGDITPEVSRWSLNYRGEFKTKETAEGVRFDDLVIDGKSTFDPLSVDFISTLDISVDRKKVGTGNISAKFDQLQFNLKFSEFPMDFLNMVGDEIKNPYWKKIDGSGEGDVKFSRIFSDENSTTLSAKLHFSGDFNLGPDEKLPGQWHLNFENNRWKTSFVSNKQELRFERRALLDFDASRVSQYHQEIHFSSYDLKNALLAVDPLTDSMAQNLDTEHTTVVLLTNCAYGDMVMDGTIRSGVTPQQNYYQVELKNKDSKLSLNYSFKKNQQLSLELKNFTWIPEYTFLAPFFNASSGLLNGSLNGKWTDHWSDGTWLLKLSGDNLQKTTGEFVELNQEGWDFFTLDSASALKRYWMASVENGVIKINSFGLESSDPALLSGVLSLQPKIKSYLSLNYPKNKKWKPVRKEVSEFFWKKEVL